MWNKSYTTQDEDGNEVKKGDRVTVAFTGEVRSVARDGLVMIKLADGGIAGFYPSYQKLYKQLTDTNDSSSTGTTTT